jgi:hypothetical protein
MKIVGGKKDLNDFMLDEGGFANSEEKTKSTTSVANLHSKYISKLFNQIFKEKEEKESEEEEDDSKEEQDDEEEEEEEEIDDDEDY